MADLLLNEDGELGLFVNQNCQRRMTVTRNVTRCATVGALVTVWGVMRLRGTRIGDDLICRKATTSVVDDIADLPGFGSAMEAVGWVEENEEGIVFPNFFNEYNVEPEKKGATSAAERQRRYRENMKKKSDVTRDVTRDVTLRPREEKSIIENNKRNAKRNASEHPGFPEWYSVYPRKVARGKAAAAYRNAVKEIQSDGMSEDEAVAHLLEETRRRLPEILKCEEQFRAHPASWLNAKRWMDEVSAPRSRVLTDEELENWRPE
jgi:hypothetical protein